MQKSSTKYYQTKLSSTFNSSYTMVEEWIKIQTSVNVMHMVTKRKIKVLLTATCHHPALQNSGSQMTSRPAESKAIPQACARAQPAHSYAQTPQ